MPFTNTNIRKWGFACLLSMPVFYLYFLHFFNHDNLSYPTGFIQWEHIVYMLSAKEYVTGNAHFLYEWPILNNFNDGHVFFQPQIFVLGYLWKWLQIDPGKLMMLYDFVFAVFTLRVVIEIIYALIPLYKFKNLITILFCWGGGILSLAGIVLHFTFFRGSLANISDHIFFLDPAGGSWCLNFGRSLIYPLEAYYHFLFVCCIWFALKRKFIIVFILTLLLTVSHPYTSIEIICILLTWVTVEVFYFKNNDISKKQFLAMLAAFILYFIFYAGIFGRIEIYRQINQLNSLDWGYKIWHFLPAYAIVWLCSFLCIKNIPLLKKHFSVPNNRLFFWWGTVAFLLSVHGFAIKPEQPIHFTRGYIFAGFFLFSIPVLQEIIDKYATQRARGYLIIFLLCFVFLFDNITWFGLEVVHPNQTGVYFTSSEKELISFFKKLPDKGIVAGNEKNYPLNAGIQLYAGEKAWMPHPFLTFNIANKRLAVTNYLIQQHLNSSWMNSNVYMYFDKNDSTLRQPVFLLNPVFENQQYRVFKIN